jgi:23S rRNA (adenine1618-N6)-methyltransferase
MSSKNSRQNKTRLHARNRNRESYDLKALANINPALTDYIKPNRVGEDSIDFANPIAVRLLNAAILNHYYGIAYWDFPDENLCPPIPGRADYIHLVADLLSEDNDGKIPEGEKITCLDIGVGASCIYPIIGIVEYGWQFIGSDVDANSIHSAQKIINANAILQDKIVCRIQRKPQCIFKGIIDENDKIDITISNPPFHASAEEALKGTQRKIKNLSGKKTQDPRRNFSGINNELIYKGGEYQFISNMIEESQQFAKSCLWFSSLVSKQSNLKSIYKSLKKRNCKEVRTIKLNTSNKSSRIIAWTFFTRPERKKWRKASNKLDSGLFRKV